MSAFPLIQVAQDIWTCALDDIPKVAVMEPVEDTSQVSWFPCLTDDSDTDTNACVSPPPKQVRTKKRVAVAQRKGGPMAGWLKYVNTSWSLVPMFLFLKSCFSCVFKNVI